jgi:uncharacterized membrane protein
MNRGQKDRIFGVIAVLVFLSIAMFGLYLLQFSLGSVPGWLMMVGGLLLFFKANRLTNWKYRHYPDKEMRLAILLFVCGAIIALLASGLEAEIRISPLRMTLAVFGILLVLSGSYFLMRPVRDP